MNKRGAREIRMSEAAKRRKMAQYACPGLVNVVQLSSGCKCGSREFVDIALYSGDHKGNTIRRDCAACNRFRCFVRWHGHPTTTVAIKGVVPAET